MTFCGVNVLAEAGRERMGVTAVGGELLASRERRSDLNAMEVGVEFRSWSTESSLYTRVMFLLLLL